MKKKIQTPHNMLNKGIFILTLLLITTSAYSQKKFTLRNPGGKIFHIKGDFTMMGNTNMTLRNYSDIGNNARYMAYVDVDDDNTTVNSSKAKLQFSNTNNVKPGCSKIVFAGLYWMGRAHVPSSASSPNEFLASNKTLFNNQFFLGYTLNIDSENNGKYTAYTFSKPGKPTHYFRASINYYWNGSQYIYYSVISHSTNNRDWTILETSSSYDNYNRTGILKTPFSINGDFNISSFTRDRRASQALYNASVNIVLNNPIELNKQKILIKGPNATDYKEVVAKASDIYYPSQQDNNIFTGFADVTDYVKEQSEGSITNEGDEYTVANIASLEGADLSGGGKFASWTLVVVYENQLMKPRDITIFDGYYGINKKDPPKDLEITGFKASPHGDINMKIGLFAGEGDVDISGDTFSILPRNTGTTFVDLKHERNRADNFFNSSIYVNESTNDNGSREPYLVNNTGIDISMFEIENTGNRNIENGQTATTFRMTTEGDSYGISMIAMSVNTYLPEITGVDDVKKIGGNLTNLTEIKPGEEAQFEVDVYNRGTEDVVNGKMYIPVPLTAEYLSIDVTTEGSATYIPGGVNVKIPDNDKLEGDQSIPAPGGYILWTLPSPLVHDNGSAVLGHLEYTVKSTTDCFTLRNPQCVEPIVFSQGIIRGKGYTSGIQLEDTKTIRGYEESGGCIGKPITEPSKIDIVDAGNFVAENCLPPDNIIVCSGETISEKDFTFAGNADGNPGSVTYKWTNSDVSIGLDASGTGNIPQFIAKNASLNNKVATIIVTPTKNDCKGKPVSYTITVKPAPTVNAIANKTICHNDKLDEIIFSGAPEGVGFKWVNDNPSIGLGESGTGNITSFTANNISENSTEATITVTPLANGCEGESKTFKIIVNPLPSFTLIADKTVLCDGESTVVRGTKGYAYSIKPNTSLSEIDQEEATVTATPKETTTYEFTAINKATGCKSEPKSITLYVNEINDGTFSEDQVICNGETPLQITGTPATGATGAIINYRWEQSLDNCNSGFIPIEGATGENYTPPGNLTQNMYYRRVVISTLNGKSCESAGDCIKVVVNNINPGQISNNQTVCLNSLPLQFNSPVVATGSGIISYQWQKSTQGCTAENSFTDIAGATNATYKETSSLVQTTYYRRKAVSTLNGSTCEKFSNCIVVTVNNIENNKISSDVTICEGEIPSGNIQGTDPIVESGATKSYVWEYSTTNGSSGFIEIPGVAGKDYVFEQPIKQDVWYRRKVEATLNGNTCSTLSNVIKVTVNELNPGNIGSFQEICEGGNPQPLNSVRDAFSSSASVITYQWQESIDGTNWNNVSSAGTSASYDPGVITRTTQYRRIAYATLNNVICSKESNVVTVEVVSTPFITRQPQNKEVCQNEEAKLNVLATNGTPSLNYQWERSDAESGPWTLINGANLANYDAPTTEGGITYYRVRITATGAGCGKIISTPAKVTVNEEPLNLKLPEDITLYTPENSCTAVANYINDISVEGTTPTYKYVFTGKTTGRGDGTGSGENFNIGVTQVEITASNDCGSINGSFKVTVIDNIDPIISCNNANLIVDTQESDTECKTEVLLDFPTYSDNCSVKAVEYHITFPDGNDVFSQGQGDGAYTLDKYEFPIGTSTFKYTVIDASDNRNSCEFTVTVNDKTTPQITCPTLDNSYNADASTCMYKGSFEVIATDNCSDNVAITYLIEGAEITYPYNFPIGTTTVKAVAIDKSKNTSECSFDVVVVDNSAPVITQCPDKPTEVSGCDTDALADNNYPAYSETKVIAIAEQFKDAGITIKDCDNNLVYSYIDTKENVINPCGIQVNRVWTVTDGFRNASIACTQEIKIINRNTPKINEPDGASTVYCTSELKEPTTPTVKDACGNLINPELKSVVNTPSKLECEGTQVYTYEYKDCVNNSATWKYTYTLKSKDFSAKMAPNTIAKVNCVSEVQQSGTPPEVRDNCGNKLEYNRLDITPADYASQDCFQGDVVFAYSYTDCSGKYTNVWKHTVTVKNEVPPTANQPGDLSFKCITDIPEADPSALSDLQGHCGNTINVTVSDSDNGGSGCYGDPFIVTRTYVLTDCTGLTNTYTQKLVAENDVKPTISNCPGNLTSPQDEGEAFATLTIDYPSATAGCSGDIIMTYQFEGATIQAKTNTGGATSGSFQFNKGITTVKFIAKDRCDNTEECIFTVTVNDKEAPQLTCPLSITKSCPNEIPKPYKNLQEYLDEGGVATDNGELDSDTFKMISEVDDNNSCPKTIIRTYQIADKEGNLSSCDQTITVEDKETPTFSTSLNPITLENEAGVCKVGDIPADYTYTTAQELIDNGLTDLNDNCTPPTSLTVSLSKQYASGTCPIIVKREYSIADACGNITKAEQTITIKDTEPPVIEGTIPILRREGCDVSAFPNHINSAEELWERYNDIDGTEGKYLSKIEDNCTSIEAMGFTWAETVTEGCPIVIKRTYTLSDKCGNSVSIYKIINIEDNTPPTISNSITSKTLEGCDAQNLATVYPAAKNTESLSSLGLIFDDNCTPYDAIRITPFDKISSVSDCETKVIRTYFLTDACNNTISTTQNISIKDTKAPEISGELSIEKEEGCSANEIDIKFPPLTTVSELFSAGLTISDACSSSDDDFKVTYENKIVNDEPGIVEVHRVYTVADRCNNSITQADDDAQILFLEDLERPKAEKAGEELTSLTTTIEGCSLQVTPEKAVSLADFETKLGVNISDNCTVKSDILFDNNMQESVISNTCPYEIKRVYKFIDHAGNILEFEHFIVIKDTESPVITGSAEIAVFYGCDITELPTGKPSIAKLKSFGFNISDCTPDNKLKVVREKQEVISSSLCETVVERTISITDLCDNSSTLTRKLKIVNNTKPVLKGTIPFSETDIDKCFVEIPQAPAPELIAKQYEASCGGIVTATVSGTPSGNDCEWSVTYTYNVKDECGNTVFPSPTITYSGGNKKTPTGNAPLGTANINACFIDNSTIPVGVPEFVADEIAQSYSASCGKDRSVKVTLNSTLISGNNCGWYVIYDYKVEDACGNFRDHEQIKHTGSNLSVITGTPPVGQNDIYDCFIDNKTPPSKAPAFDASAVVANYSTACDGNLRAELTATDVVGDNCAWTLTYTFKVIDGCNRELPDQKIVHRGRNTTPPNIISIPKDVTVSCVEEIPAPDILSVVASDDCGGKVSITSRDTKESETCPNSFILNRNYIVTNSCGLSSEKVQKITVQDIQAPNLEGVPEDIETDCANIPAPALVIATDNCTKQGTVSVTLSERNTQNQDPTVCEHYNYILIRRWVAVDGCGNNTTDEQKITVLDNQAPNITGELRKIIIENGCGGISAPKPASKITELEAMGVKISDVCAIDDYLLVTYEDSSITTGCPAKFTRTYIVSDPCGNTETLSQVIEIRDNEEPTINCPEDQIRYIPKGKTVYIAKRDEFKWLQVKDNCILNTPTNNLNNSESLVGYEFPLGTTSVTWNVTDLCGNSASCTFNVIVYSPDVFIEKEQVSGPNPVREAGEIIGYKITVINNGNKELTGVNVRDILPTKENGVLSGPIESLTINNILDVDEKWEYTIDYTVNQDDIDKGKDIINTASVFTNEVPNEVVVSETTSVEIKSGVAVTKTVNKAHYSKLEEQIGYTLTAKNTGNTTLFDVLIKDPLTNFNVSIPELAPGKSKGYVVVYYVKQTDLDIGILTNTVTVSAKDPYNNQLYDDATVVIKGIKRPGISLIKIGKAPSVATAGAGVSYIFEVKNTGNVTVSDVSINDEKVQNISPLKLSRLGVGDVATFTGMYRLVQEDVDAGEVANTAIAKGMIPGGEIVSDISGTTENNDTPTITKLSQNPKIGLVKKAIYNQDNQEITYVFLVKNIGNVKITEIKIRDTKLGIVDLSIVPATLNPKEIGTATAVYNLINRDFIEGKVENTARAIGKDPNNNDIEDKSGTTVDNDKPTETFVNRTSSIDDFNNTYVNTLVTGNVLNNDFDLEGDKQTVNTTLSILSKNGIVNLNADGSYTYIPDKDFVGTDSFEYIICDNGTPQACDKSRVTIEVLPYKGDGNVPPKANNDTNIIKKNTLVSGILLSNDFDVDGDNLVITTTPIIEPVHGIVNINSDGSYTYIPDKDFVGTDSFEYQICDDGIPSFCSTAVVTIDIISEDTKNITVANDDAYNGDLNKNIEGNVLNNDNDPEQEIQSVNTTPVSEPAHGTVNINSDGSFTYTSNTDYTGPDSFIYEVCDNGMPQACAKATVYITVNPDTRNPSISLIKKGTFNDENGDGKAQEGETITYEFAIENTGNIGVNNLKINDSRINLQDLVVTSGIISPGESVRTTYEYILTQADVDSGKVVNTAIVSGNTLNGTISDTSSNEYNPDGDTPTVTPLPQEGNIQLVKTSDYKGDASKAKAGDVIEYTFVVTNIGNVTLTDVVITDQKVPGIIPSSVASLASGSNVTFTGTYTITQTDIDSGVVTNTALAIGETPSGTTVTDTSSGDPKNPGGDTPTVTPLPQEGNIQLVKTSDYKGDASKAKAGDVIEYTFVVTNIGDVTLHNVMISDPKLSNTSFAVSPSTIVPGGTATGSYSYSITQSDIDSGVVTNTALAIGETPSGTTVTDTSSGDPKNPGGDTPTVTPLPRSSAVTITKTADRKTFSKEGEAITYTIVVRNTGNVLLTNVEVKDPLTGLKELIPALVVGERIVFTTTYITSKEDLFENKEVINVVHLSAEQPDGEKIDKEAEAKVYFECPIFGDDFIIPQIITPNNDGKNDSWEIDALKFRTVCNENNKVMIFNRWGAKVYEKENYMSDNERFEGYSDNSLDFRGDELLPSGTYFYIIEVDGLVAKTGYLYLTSPKER